MGDSACLMQPFSYTYGISNETNEGNPIHALGQSISFGRFMSESLAWEKWSTFSNNRYVEEAERYSRPGSVAQKKAFFEAHYKKIAAQKAAALLEQANAESTDAPKPAEEEAVDSTSTHDSQMASTKSNEVVDQQHDVKIPNNGACPLVSNVGCREKDKFESSIADGAALLPKDQVFVEDSLEIERSSHRKDADYHKVTELELGGTPKIVKPLMKSSNSNQDSLASMSKKLSSRSSSKPSIHSRAAKVPSSPSKHTVPICSKKDNNTTPVNMKSAVDPTDKKISTPKSVHKSVNFTPIRELNRLTTKVIRKIESSRIVANSSKASKDCPTPLRTPITVSSKSGVKKHPSATPQSEARRARTPIDLSAPGSKNVSQKWRFLPTENKMQSPILSTPFSFRTEERAARRKKKLEDKFNSNDEQKVQLQTKLKEKAETEMRKLRQSFCFKARPLPNFYKEKKEQQNETKKVPLTHPLSPKIGRKPTRISAESTSPLPPQRPSIKTSGSKHVYGKDTRTPNNSFTPQSVVDSLETSPNIQKDSQLGVDSRTPLTNVQNFS